MPTSQTPRPMSRIACCRIAQESLDALKQIMTLRKLEQLLALSQGYLSRVKHGGVCPSAQLAMLLHLLSVSPKTLLELLYQLRGQAARFKRTS